MSDVLLFHGQDGGDIATVGGDVVLGQDIVTAAYLSIFGGNAEDAGTPATVSKQWWGNLSEPDPSKRYRSETQYLLSTLPPTTGNLRRIESAVRNDLQWFVSEKLARAVDAAASMPSRNSISLDILITLADGKEIPVPRATLPWGGLAG